jgi:hypothetical protein
MVAILGECQVADLLGVLIAVQARVALEGAQLQAPIGVLPLTVLVFYDSRGEAHKHGAPVSWPSWSVSGLNARAAIDSLPTFLSDDTQVNHDGRQL